MRVNVYAEEMTNRVEIVSKTIDGEVYTGVRFYLELPVTIRSPGHMSAAALDSGAEFENVTGPFIHREGDDDSAAVTFWGKHDLRIVLLKALDLLGVHTELGAAARQPIKTAPRDGTPIIVFLPEGHPCLATGQSTAVEAWWRKSDFQSNYDCWESVLDFAIHPTHWVPMPPSIQPVADAK